MTVRTIIVPFLPILLMNNPPLKAKKKKTCQGEKDYNLQLLWSYYLPPKTDPAGCIDAIKLHSCCVTEISEELFIRRAIVGPDHPKEIIFIKKQNG